MPGWQVTAKTVFCESVDDEVTWMVFRDGSTRCTGCQKYEKPNDFTRRMIKLKTRRLGRPIRCEGDSCGKISPYKEQIFAEENKQSAA